jgi:hypothetical protein
MTGQRIRRGLALGAAMMMAAPAGARAEAGCWNQTQVAAAKVRDLQSRLMVATLRCAAMGVNVAGSYNRFVAANRGALQAANAVLLAQFRSGFGRLGQTEYDRFATSLANIYGDDATNATICGETEVLADEAAAANGEIGRLVAIEDRLGFVTPLPGGQCSVTFAAAGTD